MVPAIESSKITLTIAGAAVTVQRMDKASATWVAHPSGTEEASAVVQVELEEGGGELLKIGRRPR